MVGNTSWSPPFSKIEATTAAIAPPCENPIIPINGPFHQPQTHKHNRFPKSQSAPFGLTWGGGLVPVPGEWCRRIQHSDRVPSFPSSLHPQSPKPNTAIHHHRTNCSPQRQISRVHRRSRHRQGEFYVGRSGRPRQCPVCQMLCGCHRLFWRRCCRSALVLGIMESARGGEGDLGEAVEGQDSVPGCHRW